MTHGLSTPLRSRRGSVLILVLWICFGLVALTLYFANSVSLELRAANNRLESASAQEAANGAARYATYVLKTYGTGGTIPALTDYTSEQMPIGEAYAWFIGRDNNQKPGSTPVFGLVDEASKLNLNTATAAMLEALPGMTPDLAAAIIDWRSTNSTTSGDSYSTLSPARTAKHGAFESVDELRLVYGATMDLLLGEDTNRNGVLDPNEDDGEDTNPADDGDGLLTPGLLEYVTVYSSQPNTINGQAKINVTSTDPQMLQRLSSLLVNRFQQQRADELRGNLAGRSPSSVLEFYQWTRMTAEEFLKVRTDLTHSTGNNVRGLINVNTAPAEVLACIPGVGTDYAQALVAYRLAHGDQLTSMAWVTEVLPPTTVSRAGRFMTDLSYQFSADIAAVGRLGRGYSRIKVIINMTTGTPRIVYRQDLGSYGWALGSGVRDALKQSNNSNL